MKRLSLLMVGMSLVVLSLGARTWAEEAGPAPTGQGKHQDATAYADDEGFIRNWLALQPIALNGDFRVHNETTEKPVLDKEYFADQNNATPAEGDKVRVDDKELEWKSVEHEAGVWKFSDKSNSLHLIVSYIVCDQEIAGVTLAVGSGGGSLWKLNGKEVVRFYGSRGVGHDQNKAESLTLKKGVNVLAGAIINCDGEAGACARFLDKAGLPFANIRVTLPLIPRPFARCAVPGRGTPPVIAGTVTITGVIKNFDKKGGKEHDVFVTALDGPPEIKAAFTGITDAWPSGGLDGPASRNIENQFISKLMYKVDGPEMENIFKKGMWSGALLKLTGTMSVKDNQTRFTCGSYSDAKFTYPSVMMMSSPDVPLHTSTVGPLVLKAGAETVRCVHIDPGSFLMGQPWYMAGCTPWDPPHMVTLTRGFYMSEIPITYEMYNAVMATPMAVPANLPPQCPANLALADARKFCEAFSKLTGRKVRLPTRAQLTYAMRCGTSNPPYGEKYLKNGANITKPTPVKSSKPNAWGFDQWIGDYHNFEGCNDRKFVDSIDIVDPDYPGRDNDQWILVGGWAIGEIEYGGGAAGDGKTSWSRYRMVVEE